VHLTSKLLRALAPRIAATDKEETRLCIIIYHRILEASDPLLEGEPDVKTFRWQMELLADCFNVIPLYDAVMALENRSIPPRAVSITFDDGYRSIYKFGLPILKEFNLPATVFVTAGSPSVNNLWNDRVLESLRQLPNGQLDLREIGLGIRPFKTLKDRKSALCFIKDSIKYRSPPERIEAIQKLEGLAGNTFSQHLMLTHEMISALANDGIEIGGHTMSHPILSSLEDEVARNEIVGNKKQLEVITGKPVRLFAYPNGKVGKDYDERHVQMVREAGYLAAFSTARGAATQRHDRYQLPRSRPWDSTPLAFGIRLLSWFSDRPL
jgi:peptidoglycan/xylan/chitin deacetylase (PgdA/CDA1 family)